MLSSMFEGRFGQFLAPDPKIAKEQENNQPSRRSFMEILAPDPRYYGENKSDPPQTDSPVSATNVTNSSGFKTPNAKTNYSNSFKSNAKIAFSLDSLSDDNDDASTIGGTSTLTDDLQSQVLSAARATADALKSPTAIWEERHKFFSLCCSTKPLSEKQIKRLNSSLKKNPSLGTCYSVQMGSLVPDGYTPLHAAARAGNIEAARVLMDFKVPLYSSTPPSIKSRVAIDTNPPQSLPSNDSSLSNTYEQASASPSSSATATKKEDRNLSPETRKLISLRTTDLQGRQPLHVASEYGHAEIVSLLRERLKEEQNGIDPVGLQAPVDLSGRTPLGWACTSREQNARKHRVKMEKVLFSPGDASICGPFSPPKGRSSRKLRVYPESGVSIGMVEFGYAEMAGWRVEMEDALCCHYPVLLGDNFNNDSSKKSNAEEVGLFGVFDGHGDGGVASRFIADNLLTYLQREWINDSLTDKAESNAENQNESSNAEIDSLQEDKNALINVACELDEVLKTQNIQRNGGSTGVFALLKKDHLIVANVGDSRAILVSLSNDLENDSQATPESPMREAKYPIRVKSLSEDHKPNLPEEKHRIENAGLKVIVEKFENETFHKIQLPKSPDTKIAVSRAFGDFDFKANPDLSSTEQAIICVPELTIHKRDSEDQFLILACDGVWDVMSNEEVGQFVYGKWKQGMTVLAEVGDELLKECLARGSRDNMTALIVRICHDRMKGRLNFD